MNLNSDILNLYLFLNIERDQKSREQWLIRVTERFFHTPIRYWINEFSL